MARISWHGTGGYRSNDGVAVQIVGSMAAGSTERAVSLRDAAEAPVAIKPRAEYSPVR